MFFRLFYLWTMFIFHYGRNHAYYKIIYKSPNVIRSSQSGSRIKKRGDPSQGIFKGSTSRCVRHSRWCIVADQWVSLWPQSQTFINKGRAQYQAVKRWQCYQQNKRWSKGQSISLWREGLEKYPKITPRIYFLTVNQCESDEDQCTVDIVKTDNRK